jgi:hypothetical protein
MDDLSQKFRMRFSSDDIVNAVVPIYARHFSLDDIQALIQFYESPLGQRFVEVLPQISQESQAVGVRMTQKAFLDTLREMSSEYPDLKKPLQSDSATPNGGAIPARGANPAPASGVNQK